MRAAWMKIVILFFVTLTLAGCSVASDLRGATQRERQLLSSATATVARSTPTPAQAMAATTPSTPPAAASTVAATATAATPSSAVETAIKAVIQRGNDEQQQAFAKNDPTIMKDTATSGYYAELARINRDMANGGVSAIKLIKIEWGPITVRGTTAEATTYETWRTTFTDGTTDESRDRNVYTLVQEQGAWKIQTDAHPDSDPGQVPGGTSPNPPGQIPVPPQISPARPGESRNWSGYAATGGTYTGVSGTWTVPRPNTSGNFASGATWVGIGGVRSRDLIQAGTQEATTRAGEVQYTAWIEMLPSPSHTIPLSVNPGDSVTVSITEKGTDQWVIAFKNDTTGKTYQTTVQYNSSLSSAEWVEEAPSARRRLVPLEDFGTVQFSGGSAIKDGKSVTIAQAGAKPITMIDFSGNPVAKPSSLTPDGGGFSISRVQQTPVTRPANPLNPFRSTLPSI